MWLSSPGSLRRRGFSMLAFISRMLLFWLSGFLMSSGWINDELQRMLLTDPGIADALQTALSGVFAGLWFAWWRLAKRWGWTT